jgi:hypothetical protein
MPESFDLDSEPPTARVKAAYTKNRREAIQPLPRDVAEALREYLAAKAAGSPVWPGKWRSRGFLMIQADLAAARETWIAEVPDGPHRKEREESDFLTYRDDDGRYADFHALRHSYMCSS